MAGRYYLLATFAVLTAGVGVAADLSVYGAVYGAVAADMADGELEPDIQPPPGVTDKPASVLTADGDPAFNLRLEADVGLKATFDDSTTANVLFTFDDRKQSRFYRYSLLELEGATNIYSLEEKDTTRYIYGSLEQVNVELNELIWDMRLTVGGYDIRYGDGGYYNSLINRIDPVSFVAYLDPFGVQATRKFGPVGTTLELGAGLDRQAIAAASVSFAGFRLFGAAEGMSYDINSLRDGHYAPALPKAWRYFYRRTGFLDADVVAKRGGLGNTLHFGIEKRYQNPSVEFYAVAAYHAYADDAGIAADPTGGTLLQLYPDVGVGLVKDRLWLRAAFVFEQWEAHYHSAFGDGLNKSSYVTVYAEPQIFLTPKLLLGIGGRYMNPDVTAKDNEKTYLREDINFNVAAVPRLSYRPADKLKIDISYVYALWDPTYDDRETTFREDRESELKLEIGASF